MSIETIYRGYRINYSENAEEWTCLDAGNGMSHPKLSGVKAKIDALFLAERKLGATPCLEIIEGSGECVTLIDATVIEYLGPVQERSFLTGKKKAVEDHAVAVIARRAGRDKASRREGRLSGLAPDTLEVRNAWAEAQRLHRAYAEAQKAYRAAVKAIPRLALDDVMPLVTISGIDPEGKP